MFNVFEKANKGYRFERFKKLFIKVDRRFGQGYSKLSWIKGLIEFYFIFTIWLVSRNMGVNNSWVILAFLSIVILLWLFGYLWDRTHMFHLEAEFSNERNYFVIEMRKAIDELRKDLNNLKK